MLLGKETIKNWFNRADENCTHMLIVCDTFDYDHYPVFVKTDENVDTVYKNYLQKDMQKVMEVYNLSMDIDEQLKERRSFNF
jgi:uncharacterized membrane protein YjjP (DUF1212 family)